ncbi:TPA: hypothetical protein ACV7YJ_005235 [Escherichia coli]
MIYRLATPEDYEYIPEINLWELSFDKRPVRGVRCEDPVIGSQIYNETRQKFISHKQTEKRRKQKFFRLKIYHGMASSTGVYQKEHQKNVI